ncbi:hypothetical protein MRX96_042715 [Rhipicephalus microplus]
MKVLPKLKAVLNFLQEEPCEPSDPCAGCHTKTGREYHRKLMWNISAQDAVIARNIITVQTKPKCERSVFRIPLVRRPLGTDNQHARIATKSTQMTMKMTHSVLTQTKPKKLRSQGTNTSSGSCLEKASQERAERNCLPDSEVMRPRINQFESSHHQAGACRCRTQCTIYMV